MAMSDRATHGEIASEQLPSTSRRVGAVSSARDKTQHDKSPCTGAKEPSGTSHQPSGCGTADGWRLLG